MVEDKLVKSEATLEEATNQINRFELERSSTPDILCEHCDHDHGKECCLYVGDDHSDILRYSNFKSQSTRNIGRWKLQMTLTLNGDL